MSSYLQCREEIYYFRYRIPVLLKPYLGKSELKVSLETGNEREALIRSHQWLRIVDCLKQLNHRVKTCQIDSEEVPETLKRLFSSSRSHLSSSAPVTSIEPEASIPSPNLLDLINEYTNLKIKKREWRTKTADYFNAMLLEFVEVTTNRPIGGFRKSCIEEYVATISCIPKNRKKKYPDLPISHFMDLTIPEEALPATRTIKEKLAAISTFFKWCVENEYLEKNPCTTVTVKSTSQSYAPFDKDDLKKMFSEETIATCNHSWQQWLPVLALYTGARQTELAQLLIEDVVKIDGIWCLNITDQGIGQRLKTKAAVRIVPIHKGLIAQGFLDYVRDTEKSDHKQLWPTLKPGRYGLGDNVSKWFRDTLKPLCQITNHPSGARKVWHSFRHTFISQAVSQGLPIAHIQQIVGHEKSILGETATYAHLTTQQLKQTLDELQLEKLLS